MTQYRLTAASYLNDRYFPEGSVVEWDGPPNKAMEAVDAKGQARIDAHRAANKKPEHVAQEVPQPGGDPADSTWAPDPRPAFAVKTTRVPDSEKPAGEPKARDKEASVSRNAASPKS